MGRNLEYFPSIASTNQYLKARLAQENVPLGATVVADEQTEGRGRLGRPWWSPPIDGLYTSFLVYPGRQLSGILSLLVGVALSDAIRRETGLDPRLKWPNDVLVSQKKCAGILVEAGHTSQPWAVIGIGVNVLGTMPDAFGNAITLATAAQGAVDRVQLYAHMAECLEIWYESWLTEGSPPILAAWRERSLTLNQAVQVQESGHVLFTGRARDIASDGALLVEVEGQRLRRVEAGEVSIRFDNGSYTPESSG